VIAADAVGTQQVSDEVLWLLTDQQNTVRDVVDSDGDLRKHIDYDSFENVSVDETYGAAVDQLFYFTGQERDVTTGMQLHGER
jgi:hypothetical protein